MRCARDDPAAKRGSMFGQSEQCVNISDIGAFELRERELVVTTANDVVDVFENVTSLREALRSPTATRARTSSRSPPASLGTPSR